MAVASELHSIGLHSTVDGKCLARLEGHQSRLIHLLVCVCTASVIGTRNLVLVWEWRQCDEPG